jgi:hypothetical protein
MTYVVREGGRFNAGGAGALNSDRMSLVVGAEGIEPTASSVSGKRSPTELRA